MLGSRRRRFAVSEVPGVYDKDDVVEVQRGELGSIRLVRSERYSEQWKNGNWKGKGGQPGVLNERTERKPEELIPIVLKCVDVSGVVSFLEVRLAGATTCMVMSRIVWQSMKTCSKSLASITMDMDHSLAIGGLV